MSSHNPDSFMPYWVEAYYGPGGRKGTKEFPNLGRPGEREGDLAIATEHADEASWNIEISISQERQDIGTVLYGRNPPIMLL